MCAVHLGSVTRIANLPPWPLASARLDRSEWRSGDYVVAEVLPRTVPMPAFELRDGRAVSPIAGDILVGALARRFATLEATGSFEAVGSDGLMHCLSDAGCFGAVTSRSRFLKELMRVEYRGHVMSGGEKLRMMDCVTPKPEAPFEIPVVLLVGTSMSAGKTYSGRVAVRELKRLGHTVLGAKLTGAGRWHDTLSFRDAGADYAFDFVDAGLPTTVVGAEEYREAMKGLLSRLAVTGATVAVIEAGASPLEPYNGGTLVEMIADQVGFTILAASDPYAVVGIQQSWGRAFDLVTGPTANTDAGVALVRTLSGLPALDLLDSATHSELRALLSSAIGLPPSVPEPHAS